ncbi:MAG: hypothetical protein LBK06_00655 [Planctomycetaceae bacterium]|jgi:hypothetical protein|nr:hypothetical protein [Planctomycetaceae bacterium]
MIQIRNTISEKQLQTSKRLDYVESHTLGRTFIPTINGTTSPPVAYQIKKASNIDVTAEALRTAVNITEESLRNQTITLLKTIDCCLDEIVESRIEISNSLPEILLSQYDNSVSLEWNFEYFRLNFTIENDPDKSFYCIASHDKAKRSFSMSTECLGHNYKKTVSMLIDFAILNS